MLMHPAIDDRFFSSGTISIEIISAMAAAVVAAAGIVLFQTSSAQVAAYSRAQDVKLDQASIASPVANCSEQTWPYYDRSCLRVRNSPSGEPHTVRFITIDRAQPTNSTATFAK
jgi:hypothetical protein